MREYDDPWWESCDDEGNPEFSAYGPKEEPDCPPCGDTGVVATRFGRRNCPSCNPNRLDVLRATIRWRIRSIRSRLTRTFGRDPRPTPDDEPPF